MFKFSVFEHVFLLKFSSFSFSNLELSAHFPRSAPSQLSMFMCNGGCQVLYHCSPTGRFRGAKTITGMQILPPFAIFS